MSWASVCICMYNMAYNFIAYCSRWSRHFSTSPPPNGTQPLVICAFVRDERRPGTANRDDRVNI